MSQVKLDDVLDIIKKKIHTPESLHAALLDIVDSGEATSILEAVNVFCDLHGIDGEELAPLIDDTLKGKMRLEAESRRMLKSKTSMLPED
jgi:hypothetical protein